MLNNVVLQGRIGNDVELRTTPNGKNVVVINLAVKRNYGSDITDWISVVSWEKTAIFISKYFEKGDMVIVNGTLQTRKYTTQDGQNRTVFEVVANNVYFGGDKQKTATNENNNDNNGGFDYMDINVDERDLPF